MEKISGPVNLCHLEYFGLKLYLFSDIHMPIIGGCDYDSVDFIEFLKVLFRENPKQRIDFYLENRLYVFGDSPIDSSDSDLLIPLIFSSFSSCFRNLDKSYSCPFPNVSFYNIDIRYGQRNNIIIQRTLFSVFEKINSIVAIDPEHHLDLYTRLLKCLLDEYWFIVDYYLTGDTLFDQLALPKILAEYDLPIAYQELRFSDNGNVMAPTVFQLSQLNPFHRIQIVAFMRDLYSDFYDKFVDIVPKQLELLDGKKLDEEFYDNHQIVSSLGFKLLFGLFDTFVLSVLLQPCADIKILYVGGSHVDTYMKFFDRINIDYNFFGTADTDNIIAQIFQCRNSSPLYRNRPLSEVLQDQNFKNLVKTQIPSFQCIRFR